MDSYQLHPREHGREIEPTASCLILFAGRSHEEWSPRSFCSGKAVDSKFNRESFSQCPVTNRSSGKASFSGWDVAAITAEFRSPFEARLKSTSYLEYGVEAKNYSISYAVFCL